MGKGQEGGWRKGTAWEGPLWDKKKTDNGMVRTRFSALPAVPAAAATSACRLAMPWRTFPPIACRRYRLLPRHCCSPAGLPPARAMPLPVLAACTHCLHTAALPFHLTRYTSYLAPRLPYRPLPLPRPPTAPCLLLPASYLPILDPAPFCLCSEAYGIRYNCLGCLPALLDSGTHPSSFYGQFGVL